MTNYAWDVIIFQIIFPSVGVTLLMVACSALLANLFWILPLCLVVLVW